MRKRRRPRYPFITQILCVAVAGLCLHVYVWSEGEGHLQWQVSLPLPLVLLCVGVAVLIMPALVYLRRLTWLNQATSMCGRCEAPLETGVVVGLYGRHFLCRECTRRAEALTGWELPKLRIEPRSTDPVVGDEADAPETDTTLGGRP